MRIIDNLNTLLGDDLKASILLSDQMKIAASCFSIFAYEALKSELSKIDSLEFIFTAPTFPLNEVTDKFRKEHREFFILKVNRERSLYDGYLVGLGKTFTALAVIKYYELRNRSVLVLCPKKLPDNSCLNP